MNALLHIEGLDVELGTAAQQRVVSGLSLTVAEGSAFGIVGESGSGKTMLLRSIAGILPDGARASWERFSFDGAEIDARADRTKLPISTVFQDPMTSFNPLVRIGAHLTEVVHRAQGKRGRGARTAALDALAAARIPDPERVFARYPHELSGGLRQRAMIAMSLLADPRLLLADEPTTALDATVQAEILALLAELRVERRLTTILVTHDLGVVAALCDSLAVMKDGEIVERGPIDEVFAAPAHAYTRSLLAAVPSIEGASDG